MAAETRFELRIYRNRLVLLDHKTGEQRDRQASEPFSTIRLLVGDTNTAGDLLGAMLREMVSGRFMILAPSITLLPMEQCEGGLSMIELMALRSFAQEAGFNRIFVQEPGHAPFKLA